MRCSRLFLDPPKAGVSRRTEFVPICVGDCVEECPTRRMAGIVMATANRPANATPDASDQLATGRAGVTGQIGRNRRQPDLHRGDE